LQTSRALPEKWAGAELPAGAELQLSAALRRDYPAELVIAALAQHELRLRARAKFTRAEQMWLTREGLEQASAEPIARHRATRYAGRARVADLCCGIGGDLIALVKLYGPQKPGDRSAKLDPRYGANLKCPAGAVRDREKPRPRQDRGPSHRPPMSLQNHLSYLPAAKAKKQAALQHEKHVESNKNADSPNDPSKPPRETKKRHVQEEHRKQPRR